MGKHESTTFHVVLPSYHQREGAWNMLAPWTPINPGAQRGVGPAQDIAADLGATRERFETLFDTWRRFEDCYQAVDAEIVHSAMNDLVGPAIALTDVGAVVQTAHETYAEQVDNGALESDKVVNDTWASGFEDRYQAFLNDKSALSTKEFEEKYGKDENTVANDLHLERIPYADRAFGVTNTVGEAREVYLAAIQGIDLAEMSALEFSHRPEALTQYGSEEELLQALKDSHMFGHLDAQDLERIAEQAWELYGGLPSDFTDPNGVDWVVGPDGEMVRSGSPMDPNVNALILALLADDEELQNTELPFPEGVQTIAEFAVGQGLGKIGDLTDLTIGKSVIAGWAAAIVSLVGTGFDIRRYESELSSSAPMLSEEDYQSLVSKYSGQNLIVDGVNIGLSAGTVVLTTVFGPGGTVVGFLITEVGTGVTEFVVTEVGKETWTIDEMEDAYNEETGEFVVD